jgi:4-methyl-5(b-hydroxyethyl)-thiazole monophosphate biosynthesis
MKTSKNQEAKPIKAVILLAPGFEEVESVTPIDFLRRASIEVEVLSVGVEGLGPVQGSRGIKILCDSSLETYQDVPDCVILPGGTLGAKNLHASPLVGELVAKVQNTQGLVASICASPALVLDPLGVLKDEQYTCYPGFEKQVTQGSWREDRVVVSGNLITSRSAGTASEFSLAIIEYLVGAKVAQEVKTSTLVR